MKHYDSSWSINPPLPAGPGIYSVVDAAGKILVQVNNTDTINNRSFTATTYPVGSGSAPIDCEPLAPEDSTLQFFSAKLLVGTPHSTPTGQPNYQVVVVCTKANGSQTKATVQFEAVSSGSGSHTVPAPKAHHCQFVRADQPVPVELQLQLDTLVATVTGGEDDPLNQPTRLVHSVDSSGACAWLSEPIDLRTGGANTGFWVLQKCDARTWILLLRCGDVSMVSYRFTTASDYEDSFPIQLGLFGPAGIWPRTITITPAP